MIALGHHHGAAHPRLDAGHAGRRSRSGRPRRSAPTRTSACGCRYCYAVRDQNRLVYQADEEFVASLPTELQGPMQRWYDRFQMRLDDAMDMFKSFTVAHHNKRRVKIQLAPANLHWCSDKALTRARRRLAQVRRADAHASGRDRIPEGICLAARRLHGAGIHRPLRPARTAADAGPRRVAERGGHRSPGRRPAPASATTARPISACARAWRR